MADKVIQVNVTSTKSQRVSVSPGNVQNEISATPDSSQYYSNLAKNWAIGAGLILNEDYSSKHYANESAKSASSAKNYADASQTTYTNVQNVASEALTNIEDARVDAVDNITTVKDESIASVEAKANEASALVNTGIANINTAKTEAVNAVTTTKNNAVTEINNKVTDGKQELNDIIEAGGLNFNDKITNCLLEVPQNIKVELSNGTLTLKAGSKVIVPNGVGVFDDVVTTQDQSITYNWKPNSTRQCVVFANETGGISNGYMIDISTTFSGSTAPTKTNYTWYDTANNIVKSHNGNQQSLPIAIITQGSDGVTKSIDQVFNGFGYIGNTIFCDKGVKGLIPNGRNEDGSLKNIEITLNQVSTTSVWSANKFITIRSNGAITARNSFEYKEEENLNYVNGSNTYSLECVVANVEKVGNNISNFQPKLPFRAVDYNDIAGLKAYITETYQNGTSWYRIWSDGWCEQGGRTPAQESTGYVVTLLKAFSNTDYNVMVTDHWTNAPEKGWGNAHTYTTTSFKIVQTSDGADWRACGYIS